MLQYFRNQQGKWFTKILFGAIALSFVIFGVADVAVNYTRSRPLVKFKGGSISFERFARSFDAQLKALQAKSKSGLTAQQIKDSGIAKLILDDLINQEILSVVIKQSGLKVSDNILRNYIKSNNAFKKDGVFNKELFQKILKSQGLSEADVLQNIYGALLQEQFFTPLVFGASLPDFYKNKLVKAYKQVKQFTVVNIKIDDIKKPTLSEEQLKLHYNQNKENYKVPEIRETSLLLLKKNELKQLINVTEEELKQEYENRKTDFMTPQKREVKSLTYSSKEMAVKAKSLIDSGASFPSVIKAVPGGKAQSLGEVEQKDMPPVGAEPAFSVMEGKTTEVIDTGFGFILYQVTKIIPEKFDDFATVKTKVLDSIREDRFASFMHELKIKIQDELAAGTSLEAIAKKHNLKLTALEGFDKRGLTKDKNPALKDLVGDNKYGPEILEKIIDQTFALEKGKDSDFVDINADDSFVLQVKNICEAYIPDFAEVKDKVQGELTFKMQKEDALKITDALVNKINSDTSSNVIIVDNMLIEFSTKNKFKLQQRKTLSLAEFEQSQQQNDKEATKSQNDLLKEAAPTLLDTALQTPVGKATYGFSKDGKTVIIMMNFKAEDAPAAKGDAEFAAKIGESFAKDSAALLMDAYRTEAKVEIDDKRIEQLMTYSD